MDLHTRSGFYSTQHEEQDHPGRCLYKEPLGEATQPNADKWTADSYNQYNLSHVGESSNGAIHKFTVSGFDASDCISAGQRKYNVSRFDLHYAEQSTATNYKEGRSYIFTGSGKNLKSEADGLEVIYIDNLQQTTFRYDNLVDNGEVQRETQISTVYFSIPAEYEAKYDELFSIKCDYDRYRSMPMIVTVEEGLFKEYAQWILKRLNSDGLNERPDSSLYLLHSNNYVHDTPNTGHFDYIYDWSYNARVEEDSDRLIHLGANSPSRVINSLFWLFCFKGEDGKWGNDNINDAYVLYQDVLRYYDNYVKAGYSTEFIDLALNGLIQANRSGDYGHHIETILASDNYDEQLKGFQYSSWWKQFLAFVDGEMKETESIENVSCIQKLYPRTLEKIETDSVINGYSLKEYFAKNYLINGNDCSDFLSFARQEAALGNTVVVFHFASSVYEVYDAVSYHTGITGQGVEGRTGWGGVYACTQDLFLNFTIIEMTFGNEYEQTVIPVNAPNINISGGTSPGQGDGLGDVVRDSGLLDQILGILMLILTILGFAFIVWGLSIVLKPILAVGEAAGRRADSARLRREIKRDQQNPPPGSTINVYIDGKKAKTKVDKLKNKKGKKR